MIALGIAARFFQLQVLEHDLYRVLASDQHEVQASLIPRRGTIYVRDRADKKVFPVAMDRDAWQVYAVPREMKDKAKVAEEASPILGIPSAELLALWTPTTTYKVLVKDAPLGMVDTLREKRIPGIGVNKGLAREYPERGIGGQFLGFVSLNEENHRVGRYGIEGANDATLAGTYGSIVAEKDAAGRRLTIGDIQMIASNDGSDLVLTIDRNVQYFVCAKIAEAVRRFEAESGTVVIMEPNTGALIALCSAPDFEPSTYREAKDISVLNNPATFYAWEPGSIFKPLTLAAGIERGKITPRSTYTDKGEETMDDFTVRNSDKKAHGVQTMTQVLEKSLNTGTIHVQRLLGKEAFREFVVKFGFGEKTGIEMQTEAKGNIASLVKKGQIFAATASYGQGITTTPIQMVASFGALANGGVLMKPYVIAETIDPDGVVTATKPQEVRRVISERTGQLVTAMMVNVVENGHGKKAGVPGYWVAGKTGTAQVPDPNGRGYLPDATIGSFAGYAPAEKPVFVMLVKIDKPKTVQYAEASAAPIFGEIAAYLLQYYQVPPERPIVKPPPPVPTPPPTATQPSTSTTR